MTTLTFYQTADKETVPAEVVKEVTTVSDVDAHSQCKMRVKVKKGRVIEIHGDPTDPEGKGELTMRGKHMKGLNFPNKKSAQKKRPYRFL